jgi:hypothetical protein
MTHALGTLLVQESKARGGVAVRGLRAVCAALLAVLAWAVVVSLVETPGACVQSARPYLQFSRRRSRPRRLDPRRLRAVCAPLLALLQQLLAYLGGILRL